MFQVILEKSLDRSYLDKWKRQFVDPGRSRAEGIWRRTQCEETKEKSGWNNENDARRRMIHFLDEYDMIENENGGVDFCITGVYLWMSQTLSKEESTVFNRKVINALNYNGWKKTGENQYALGELELSIQNYKVHPEDIKVNRVIPKNYRMIEYRLKSNDMTTENRVIDSPWVILNSGMRKQGNRTETPYISDKVELIQEYLPMQIEIAGGASIGLGIPPLNHLHSVYNVNNKETGDYILEMMISFLTS